MKNILLAMLATLALSMLFGCNNRTAYQQPQLEPMQQSYRGTLPCYSQRRSVEASLFLGRDGHYVLEQHNPKHDNIRTAQYGKWARTADKLTLTNMEGEKKIFRPTEEGLEIINQQSAVADEQHRNLLIPIKT